MGDVIGDVIGAVIGAMVGFWLGMLIGVSINETTELPNGCILHNDVIYCEEVAK